MEFARTLRSAVYRYKENKNDEPEELSEYEENDSSAVDRQEEEGNEHEYKRLPWEKESTFEPKHG